MKKIITAVLSLVLTSSFIYAEEDHKMEHKFQKSIENMPKDLRKLLSREMKYIQMGMNTIGPAYISGNWQDIEKTAKKIKDSYILKQKLSPVVNDNYNSPLTTIRNPQ